MDIAYAAKFLGALFAIMNPFVSLPLFLALTSEQDVAQQRRTAWTVALYAAVMCVVLSLAGGNIIAFFGVSVDSFRVAGGIVLLGIALSMLNGQPITSHERGAQEKAAGKAVEANSDSDDSIAFYPMTFPMIIGPGTIATLIIYAAQIKGSAQYVAFAVVLSSVLAALLIILYFAAAIGQLLSAKMRVIMARIMGMILAAIAVEMVVVGVKTLLPGLA